MRISAVLTFVVAIITSTTAAAAPILDQQSFGSLGASYVSGTQSLAQSFTVGLDGLLTSVDVSVYRFEGTTAPLTVKILSNPLNFSSSLYTTTVAAASIGLDFPGSFVNVDVSAANLFVNAGDVFAIGLFSSGGYYAWTDAVPLYLRGTAYAATYNSGGVPFQMALSDFTFRTYVEPSATAAVPEPASILLLGTGLAGAGLRRWRQKRA